MENLVKLPTFKERAGAVVGFGPPSAMQYIELHTQESLKQTNTINVHGLRVPIVMHYANIPQEAETLALSGQLRGDELVNLFENVFGQTLYDSFKVLASAECTFAHIHCNTLGHVVNAFGIKERFKDMEVLTVADAIRSEFTDLKESGIKKVIPIGTNLTVHGIPELSSRGIVGGMYDGVVEQAGLEFIKPNDSEQAAINLAILECIHNESSIEEQTELFEDVLRSNGVMPGGDSVGLICCTDLNIHGRALREKGFNIVDTAESVIRNAVKRMVMSMETT